MLIRRGRRAFSLLELALSAAIVAMLASMAFLFLGDEGPEAYLARARMELSSMAREVQARSLRAPNYHFDTLAQALGRREPPLDPWGNPYVLMHGQSGSSYRPELTYWRDGVTDALYAPGQEGEAGDTLLTHYIVSAGPNVAFHRYQAAGTYDPEEDDLSVPVKLGKPSLKRRGGSDLPTDEGLLGTHSSPTSSTTVQIYDHGSEDGDRVRFLLNGTLVEESITLRNFPGTTLDLSLQPGTNTVSVQAHNEGSEPPNTASMRFGGSGFSGGATYRWTLKRGGIAQVQVLAPGS